MCNSGVFLIFKPFIATSQVISCFTDENKNIKMMYEVVEIQKTLLHDYQS